jgi:hypothetical protein
MHHRLLAISAFAFVSACVSTPTARTEEGQLLPSDDRRLERLTADHLETFSSEREFMSWLRDVRRAQERRDQRSGRTLANQFALLEPPPCPPDKDCPLAVTDFVRSDRVVVTGSMIAAPASSTSITNTQMVGVDEGDIVKQIGRFLVVLQDGRLFTVDTGAAAGEMRLVDRMNVYRRADYDTWIDEMLVQDHRIVVLGYSYAANASEFSVFTLGEDGTLRRDASYLLSSNDYYDADNYATRLVGDKLIIYTPVDLSDVDPDASMSWPSIRRWTPEEDAPGGKTAPERRLFDARHIYRPVQPTLQPMIHAVSICPLTDVGSGRDLDCETTALVGPQEAELYATTSDAWLWISPGYDERRQASFYNECPAADLASFDAAPESGLYRVPLRGRDPSMIHVRGTPANQFGLDANASEFRALVVWGAQECSWSNRDDEGRQVALKYFRVPLGVLQDEGRTASRSSYFDVPGVTTNLLANRFTDTHLVYAGRVSWGYDAPEMGEPPQTASVVVLPTRDPRAQTTIEAPHSVIRAERAGDRMVLTGYRDAAGLSVSMMDLERPQPALSDTEILTGRFESEGRSHAFNSRILEDGSGLMGLPTVGSGKEGGRRVSRSEQSDVSFLSADAAGRLSAAGELETRAEPSKAYECEVSCVDWYGNTRPIFIGDRIFALSGVELIEGAMAEGRILPRARLNLSVNPPRRE